MQKRKISSLVVFAIILAFTTLAKTSIADDEAAKLLKPADLRNLPPGTFVTIVWDPKTGEMHMGLATRNDGHFGVLASAKGKPGFQPTWCRTFENSLIGKYLGGGVMTGENGKAYTIPRNSTQSQFLHGDLFPANNTPQMPDHFQSPFMQAVADRTDLVIEEAPEEFLGQYLKPKKGLTPEEDLMMRRAWQSPIRDKTFYPQSMVDDLVGPDFRDPSKMGIGGIDLDGPSPQLQNPSGCGCPSTLGKILNYGGKSLLVLSVTMDASRVYYADTPQTKDDALTNMMTNLSPAAPLILLGYPDAETRRAAKEFTFDGAWGGGPDVSIQRAPDRTWMGWVLGYPQYSPLPDIEPMN